MFKITNKTIPKGNACTSNQPTLSIRIIFAFTRYSTVINYYILRNNQKQQEQQYNNAHYNKYNFLFANFVYHIKYYTISIEHSTRLSRQNKHVRSYGVCESTANRIFHGPFYYGILEQGHNYVDLRVVTSNFKPMVTKEEYNQV